MFRTGLKELNEVSTKICEDFALHFPPSMQGEKKPHARKQFAAALMSVDLNIDRYLATSPKLGVFKKAKCANDVKWGLKDKGYQEELVDTVTRKVIHGLARTEARAKAK